MIIKPARDTIVQIIIAILSAAFLIFLAIRYPALPDRIPIQFQLNGDVSRWADKRIFAPVAAIAVAAFNGYLVLLRRQKQEIRILLPIVFVALLVVITTMSIL